MGVDARMYVHTMERLLSEESVNDLAYRLCAVFGRDRFFVKRPGEWYPQGRKALTRLASEDEECNWEDPERVLEVHLSGRYWGPGYERGDFAFYCTLADWLEIALPGCRVYYGGDSGGGVALFDRDARVAHIEHAAGPEGAAYHNRAKDGVMCDFCARAMTQNLWSGSTRGYVCLGCDLHSKITATGARTDAVGKYPE